MGGNMKKVLILIMAMMLTAGCIGCAANDEANEKANQSVNDSEEVAVDESEADSADKKKQLEVTDNPSFIAEGIRRAVIYTEGEKRLELSYEPHDYEESYEYWKIREPYGDYAVVDTEHILELFGIMESIKLEEASVSDDIRTELLKGDYVIEIEYCEAVEGDESSSYQAKADSMTKYHVMEGDEGSYYVMLNENTDIVYKTSGEEIKDILNSEPFDLILKIVAAVPLTTVEELTISLAEERDTISGDDEDFGSIYPELIGLIVKGEAQVDLLTKEEIISFEIKRNIQELENITVVFHEYDAEYASVSVNGVEKLLVNKNDVKELEQRIKEVRNF